MRFERMHFIKAFSLSAYFKCYSNWNYFGMLIYCFYILWFFLSTTSVESWYVWKIKEILIICHKYTVLVSMTLFDVNIILKDLWLLNFSILIEICEKCDLFIFVLKHRNIVLYSNILNGSWKFLNLRYISMYLRRLMTIKLYYYISIKTKCNIIHYFS